MAALEGGAGAVVTASGMAAVTLVVAAARRGRLLSRRTTATAAPIACSAHSRSAAPCACEFVDQTDDAGARRGAGAAGRSWSGSKRRAIRCCASSTFARWRSKAHAVRRALLVDNTFLSPVWQQPIALGADLVLHSTTKYLNGHSDVVGGAVVARTPELHEQLVWWANCIGVTGAPFDSYLTLRGLRTLHARLRVHGENAERIAAHLLAAHPAVAHVYYPGLRYSSAARARAPAADRFRRDGELRAARRHCATCARSSTGCSASRSPSRWAASRASSRIRRA